jgi:hypothetical protein
MVCEPSAYSAWTCIVGRRSEAEIAKPVSQFAQVEFALRYCQVLIELAKPRQIAGGQLHPRRGMNAGPEEEIALLMRRWEQVKAGDGAVVLIGGEPGNREIAPRAAAHRVAEARRIVANQSSRSNGGLTTFD